MIINLRGTSGSGKSTIVRQLMHQLGSTPLLGEDGQIEAYKLGRSWYTLGRYTTPCGGCDTIHPYSSIQPLLLKYARLGNVIFEGLILSNGGLGAAGWARALPGHRAVFAFLDTPLQTCIERVQARRSARGNPKPLNPKNTVDKWERQLRLFRRYEATGASCIWLNHQAAAIQVLELMQSEAGLNGRL